MIIHHDIVHPIVYNIPLLKKNRIWKILYLGNFPTVTEKKPKGYFRRAYESSGVFFSLKIKSHFKLMGWLNDPARQGPILPILKTKV